MRRIAMISCWVVIAFCAACASDPAVRPVSLPATNKAELSAGPDRVAHVASRLALALADVCDCRSAQHVESTSLRLCGYPIKIENRSELYASTNGKRISLTRGMLRFFARDDELAFVLAHELSHILLGHVGAFNGISSTATEAEADKLGIHIVSDAHFDTKIAAEFPERLAQFYPSINGRYGAHQMSAQRTAMIGSALREDSGPRVYANLRGECAK
jgi:hypothetical protein